MIHVSVHRPVSKNQIGFQRAKEDRKSTRLNSSHLVISYDVFCLKKIHNQSLPRERSERGLGGGIFLVRDRILRAPSAAPAHPAFSRLRSSLRPSAATVPARSTLT